MTDASVQTRQLAEAIAAAFPDFQFEKNPQTGVVVITASGLTLSVSQPVAAEPLLETNQAGVGAQNQPLGAPAEPAYKSTGKATVPVQSQPTPAPVPALCI